MRLFFNREQWDELWYTLKRNKKRSLVTSLGVFAGMFLFTVLTSLGNGMGNQVSDLLNSVSNDIIFLMPGRTTMPYDGYKSNRAIKLTYRDYLAIQQQTNSVHAVEYVANFNNTDVWGYTQVQANNLSKYMMVMGLSEGYFRDLAKIAVIHGRNMTPAEYQSTSPVCLIGIERAKQLFAKEQDAVGKIIMLAGVPVQIVGVVQSLADNVQLGFNVNYAIAIPAPLALKNDFDNEVNILVTPREGFSIQETKAEVLSLLYHRKHIHPEDKEAITTISMDLFTNIFKMIGSGITWLIWIVGIGTLITGVIGISNILLVTVRERQREIGVRRAIGAKPRSIRAQFMSEAIVLILLAGSAGMLLGMLVSLGIGAMAEYPPLSNILTRPYPTLEGLLLSLGIMLVSGVFAGLLPVYKALQVKAIDAIRDE